MGLAYSYIYDDWEDEHKPTEMTISQRHLLMKQIKTLNKCKFFKRKKQDNIFVKLQKKKSKHKKK
jgi:hypothetical protein